MKRTSIFSSIMIAGVGIVSSASALPIVQHAVDFHALNAVDQASLVYSVDGVANASGANKDVVGTIVRDPESAETGRKITVVGYNEDTSVTSNCTVAAVTPVPLGTTSAYRFITVSNFNHTWTRTVAFTEAEAGPLTSFFVRCTLAPNQKSRIQSVRIPSPPPA